MQGLLFYKYILNLLIHWIFREVIRCKNIMVMLALAHMMRIVDPMTICVQILR